MVDEKSRPSRSRSPQNQATHMRIILILTLTLALVTSMAASAPALGETFPPFQGMSLTGVPISKADLTGKQAILIVTPSQKAVRETQLWAQVLDAHIDQRTVLIRDILAIELPFYMSHEALVKRVKEKIPVQYHHQTWIPDNTHVKHALHIPTRAANTYVFVLDADGNVVRRIKGPPNQTRLAAVKQALDTSGKQP